MKFVDMTDRRTADRPNNSDMKVVRASALTGYRELVDHLGGDPDLLLRAAAINPACVGDREVFISGAALINVVEAAADHTGRPDFGRLLSTKQTPEILGPLALACRSAPTTEQAFTILSRFMSAHTNALDVGLIPHTAGEYLFFAVEINLKSIAQQHQTMELSLGIALQTLRLLLGRNYCPREVHIPHAPLAPESAYRRFFGAPAVFNAAVGGFLISAGDIEQPLSTDQLVHQTTLSYLTLTAPSPQAGSAAVAVAALLGPLLPAGPPSFNLIARHFGLHPKALQRRLAAESTSFAAILDQVRREIAQRRLADPNVTLIHLSHQLGYADQSVLTRACQRWFGMTPSEYRKTAGLDHLSPTS